MTFSLSLDPLDLRQLPALMDRSLPPGALELLRLVAAEAESHALPLFIVGGFVRDLLLGHPGLDFDLVVEGDAIALARRLADRHGGRITAHSRFYTAQWFPEDRGGRDWPKALDLISTRTESYAHPGALPTVWRGSLTDDLRRRDFTVNTLAIRLDGSHYGELHDELGGLADLNAGQVRVLHPNSFVDDPTRLFRAVRYEQRYGFTIEPGTLALIPPARRLVAGLSAERLRHELDLILDESHSAEMLRRLAELDLLAVVHPQLGWDSADGRRFERGYSEVPEKTTGRRSLGWLFWLMDLPQADLLAIESRLHFEAGLRASLLAAADLLAGLEKLSWMKPSACTFFLDELPLGAVEAVGRCAPDGPARRNVLDYLTHWRKVKPKTNGNELIRRGLTPGPAFQTILTRLRAAWLDGELTSKEQELTYLEKLIN